MTLMIGSFPQKKILCICQKYVHLLFIREKKDLAWVCSIIRNIGGETFS